MDTSPIVTFGLTVALGLPVILGVCYAFHLGFEAPFLGHFRRAGLLDTTQSCAGFRGLRNVPLPRPRQRRERRAA